MTIQLEGSVPSLSLEGWIDPWLLREVICQSLWHHTTQKNCWQATTSCPAELLQDENAVEREGQGRILVCGFSRFASCRKMQVPDFNQVSRKSGYSYSSWSLAGQQEALWMYHGFYFRVVCIWWHQNKLWPAHSYPKPGNFLTRTSTKPAQLSSLRSFPLDLHFT